ncbi:MAG: hypothetical protein QG579_637 [Patescibacteria group bacterium]|jgi:hypothetical protein|nr:hypothetical protein [Patescibacteria group bacterium]
MKRLLVIIPLVLFVILVVSIIPRHQTIDDVSLLADTTQMEQKTPEEVTIMEKYQEIEKLFDLAKRDQVISDNWATEVFPGNERGADQIEQSLSTMGSLLKQLEKLPRSERYPDLKHEIELFMAHEMTSLLVVARRDQDLRGLETFLRFASRMDTSPDTFGVSPENLRNEALIMAKKEVAILRPRLREGSGDAQGYLQHILRSWRFSPNQLGLTKEEMREIADK